jgi:hypothetical protein
MGKITFTHQNDETEIEIEDRARAAINNFSKQNGKSLNISNIVTVFIGSKFGFENLTLH